MPTAPEHGIHRASELRSFWTEVQIPKQVHCCKLWPRGAFPPCNLHTLTPLGLKKRRTGAACVGNRGSIWPRSIAHKTEPFLTVARTPSKCKAFRTQLPEPTNFLGWPTGHQRSFALHCSIRFLKTALLLSQLQEWNVAASGGLMRLTYWRFSAKAQSELDSKSPLEAQRDTDTAFQECIWLPNANVAFFASASLHAWQHQKADARGHRVDCASKSSICSPVSPLGHTSL